MLATHSHITWPVASVAWAMFAFFALVAWLVLNGRR